MIKCEKMFIIDSKEMSPYKIGQKKITVKILSVGKSTVQ